MAGKKPVKFKLAISSSLRQISSKFHNFFVRLIPDLTRNYYTIVVPNLATHATHSQVGSGPGMARGDVGDEEDKHKNYSAKRASHANPFPMSRTVHSQSQQTSDRVQEWGKVPPGKRKTSTKKFSEQSKPCEAPPHSL